MANPFYIEPANPLQALMIGGQAYDQSLKRTQEQALRDAVTAAGPDIAAGNYQAAIAKLGGAGGLQGLMSMAQLQEHAAAAKRAEAQLAESSRHNRATEGSEAQKISLLQLEPKKLGSTFSGEDIYGVRNPKVPGGYERLDVGSLPVLGAPPSSGAAPAAVAPTQGLTGQAFLDAAKIPPEGQELIKKIATYDVNPSSLSIKGGHRERILSLVSQYDPTFDQKFYPTAQRTMGDMATGKLGTTTRAFNVGIEHIDQLLQLGKALNNGDIPKINAVSNWVRTNLGQSAPTNFEGLKAIVGAEIVKAIVGAGGTGEERKKAADTVAAASSWQQLEGIAKTYSAAMGAQLSGIRRQYEEGSRKKDFSRFLSERAKRAIEEHDNPASSAAPATQGVTKSGIKWSVE